MNSTVQINNCSAGISPGVLISNVISETRELQEAREDNAPEIKSVRSSDVSSDKTLTGSHLTEVKL